MKMHGYDSFYAKYVKRGLDITVACIALIPFGILMIPETIITMIDLGFPVLFRQVRPGKDGEPFVIYKFRNMNNKTDENGNLLPPEKRVSKIGKFFRATSMDELPQLINVLKGDMSIIGPRPLAMRYNEMYSERHKKRLLIRPGLECPILHINNEADRDWQMQFENDVWYVENVSFILDVKMFFALVRMVFDKNYGRVRGDAQRGSFNGYVDGVAVSSTRSEDQSGYNEKKYWEQYEPILLKKYPKMVKYIYYLNDGRKSSSV